jgi:HAD superfamily hydrolase (TIGR01509 family)
MSQFFGVLWDLDGVLVDTGDAHYHSWAKALDAHRVPFTREQFRATFGMNNAGILQLLLGPAFSLEALEVIGDEKEHYFRESVRGRVQLLPGVVEWLARLQAQGLRQAIASSAPPANIEAIVAELDLRPYFEALVSGADLPGKPDPATFLLAAEKINCPPPHCLVVEDAIAGVTAAKRAGMKCIAVTTTNPASVLQDADLITHRLDALPADTFFRLLGVETNS